MPGPAYRAFAVTAKTVERLTPHFVRVTFGGDLADLTTFGPDQRIKVLFPLPDGRPASLPAGDDWFGRWRRLPEADRSPMRTYTIRDASHGLVVDFVAHGDTGPASRWIATAAPGDELVVVAPDGASDQPAGGVEWHPGAATTVLVAGDETAVPAICGIVESLAPDARGAVFLEVPTAADILPLQAPPGVAVTWLPRESDVYGTLLDAAVRDWAAAWRSEPREDLPDPETLWEVPDEPGDAGLYAWLAGEAGAITGLRRHLVSELGIDRSRVAFMGYWKLGRAEN